MSEDLPIRRDRRVSGGGIRILRREGSHRAVVKAARPAPALARTRFPGFRPDSCAGGGREMRIQGGEGIR